MPKLKVHAGDFNEGLGQYLPSMFGDKFHLYTKDHSIVGVKIPVEDLESIDVATEENVKKVGGTVGWGAAGAVLLGPVGLLAGLLLGGKGKKVTFVAKFKDGRKLLASTDSKTYTKIMSKTFS